MSLFEQLSAAFPNLKFEAELALAKYSQVKIGGPAEVFIDIKHRDDLISLIQYCIAQNIPFYILGWGANTLIADRGLRGLVIKNSAAHIRVLSAEEAKSATASFSTPSVPSRWDSPYPTAAEEFFSQLEEAEAGAERVLVEIDAGTPLPVAINQLADQGIGGLEWYTKIPATIGGAIYNNIHGGKHLIGEVLFSVDVLDSAGTLHTLPASELQLDYDSSRFHTSQEVIISARFLLFRVDASLIKRVSIEWARAKAQQPQKSLGCVFKNISAADQKRLNLPTASAGYLIDQVLGLKELKEGDAEISAQHAAFIINAGTATAADYLAVIAKVQSVAQQKCGLFLEPEIFFLGFTKEELAGIVAPV